MEVNNLIKTSLLISKDSNLNKYSSSNNKEWGRNLITIKLHFQILGNNTKINTTTQRISTMNKEEICPP